MTRETATNGHVDGTRSGTDADVSMLPVSGGTAASDAMEVDSAATVGDDASSSGDASSGNASSGNASRDAAMPPSEETTSHGSSKRKRNDETGKDNADGDAMQDVEAPAPDDAGRRALLTHLDTCRDKSSTSDTVGSAIAPCPYDKSCTVDGVHVVGRPARSHGKSMGDHTTPFCIVLAILQNAMKGTVDEAIGALSDLYKSTQTLPGYNYIWIDPAQQARFKNEEKKFCNALENVKAKTSCECKRAYLQHAIASFLEYREMIPLSTMNIGAFSGRAGKGKYESGMLRQFKESVEENTHSDDAYGWFDWGALGMWGLGADNDRQDIGPWEKTGENAGAITAADFYEQHCKTLSYPGSPFSLTAKSMAASANDTMIEAQKRQKGYIEESLSRAETRHQMAAQARQEPTNFEFEADLKAAFDAEWFADDALAMIDRLLEVRACQALNQAPVPKRAEESQPIIVDHESDSKKELLDECAPKAKEDEAAKLESAEEEELKAEKAKEDALIKDWQIRCEGVRKSVNGEPPEKGLKEELTQKILERKKKKVSLDVLSKHYEDMYKPVKQPKKLKDEQGDEDDEGDQAGQETELDVSNGDDAAADDSTTSFGKNTLGVQLGTVPDALKGLAVQVNMKDCVNIDSIRFGGRPASPFKDTMGSHHIAWVLMCDAVCGKVIDKSSDESKTSKLATPEMTKIIEDLTEWPDIFQRHFNAKANQVLLGKQNKLYKDIAELVDELNSVNEVESRPSSSKQRKGEDVSRSRQRLRNLAKAAKSDSTISGLQLFLSTLMSMINLVPGVSVNDSMANGRAEGKARGDLKSFEENKTGKNAKELRASVEKLVDEKANTHALESIRALATALVKRAYPDSYKASESELREWAGGGPSNDAEL